MINVRYKRADGTWGSKSRNPNTGRRFASEREAERWGEEQEVKERLGLIAEAPSEEVTVNDWFATWWESLDLGLRSRGNYAYLFRAHVLPEWGEWKLADITASAVNAWEQRMVKAGYSRDGVPSGARTRLATLLGDAVTEGLIPSNPALRQRHRGRRSGAGTAGRGKEKSAATPLEAVVLAERLAIMSGRNDDFILGVLFAWSGLRWGEAMGLQRNYVKLGSIRIDWQLLEAGGRFYLMPPKDDSHRTIDLPPFLQQLLTRQIAAHPDQRCACEPETMENQEDQPCQGGGAFVFLGPKGAHQRNSNYARRFFDPAADGRYPNSKGSRVRDGRPVLVEVDSLWPGAPLPPWPSAVPGEPYERPPIRGYQGRPLGLGVNAASSRADLVAFAIEQGVEVEEAHRMTREQILDRFVRSRITEDTAVASWLPVRFGLTPHELARHTHSTWLGDLNTPLRLRDDRMGHASPEMRGMRRSYTHVSDESRPWLKGELERLWQEALAKRAWFGLHSPVTILDELLAPFRDGRRKPISPVASRAEVLQFPSAQAG
ncbi:hypothetical protein AB0F88_39675 [Streptosporangium sp. NPDC023963]|uniref:hypothetical protein n=1 Tax=Streptosporangium sp. NPDC023963 TaxID=3155608 RepID=UPI00341B330A